MQVITIGLDIAKNVFQVHGVDNAGNAVLRRKVRRDQLIPLLRDMQPCLIGMEACATAHHWARELIALGHVVKLMPPAAGSNQPLHDRAQSRTAAIRLESRPQ